MWNDATREYELAQKIFSEWKDISCSRCKSIMEISLYQHQGTLFRNMDKSSLAIDNYYKVALEKLNSTRKIFDFSFESKIDFLKKNWELVYKRHIVRLLTGVGKIHGNYGQVQDAHDVFFEIMSALLYGDWLRYLILRDISSLIEAMGKEHLGIIEELAVEHAIVLYNISCFCLKNIDSKDANIDTITHPSHLLVQVLFKLCLTCVNLSGKSKQKSDIALFYSNVPIL